MRIKYFIMFTLISIIVYSCGNAEKTIIEKMPDHFEETDFSLDIIADSMLIIPFSNEVPLVKSKYIKGSNEHIYYCQPWEGKISRYTDEGKLIDELDKQGRGEGEYEFIVDFFIDNITGYTYISTNIRRIVVYDNDFNYLKDIKYPQVRTGILITRWLLGNIHLFYFPENKKYNWMVIDTNGIVLNTVPNIDTYRIPSPTSAWQVFRNSSKLYRYHDYNDTIYEIDSAGLHPYRVISRNYSDGFNDFWDKDIVKNRRESGEPKRKVKSIIGVGKYWIIHFRKTEWSKDYIVQEIVLYDIEENRYYLLNDYNRNKHQYYQNGIPNDWVGAGCLFPMGTLEMKGDRYLFSVMDAYRFLEFVNSNDFEESIPRQPYIKEKFQDIADNLTIEDNPILFLLKLK